MLDVLCYGYERDSLWEGSDLGSWLISFLYLACIEWYSHIFACGGACVAGWGAAWMDFCWLISSSLWSFCMVTLSAIWVCVELLEAKAH